MDQSDVKFEKRRLCRLAFGEADCLAKARFRVGIAAPDEEIEAFKDNRPEMIFAHCFSPIGNEPSVAGCVALHEKTLSCVTGGETTVVPRARNTEFFRDFRESAAGLCDCSLRAGTLGQPVLREAHPFGIPNLLGETKGLGGICDRAVEVRGAVELQLGAGGWQLTTEDWVPCAPHEGFSRVQVLPKSRDVSCLKVGSLRREDVKAARKASVRKGLDES